MNYQESPNWTKGALSVERLKARGEKIILMGENLVLPFASANLKEKGRGEFQEDRGGIYHRSWYKGSQRDTKTGRLGLPCWRENDCMAQRDFLLGAEERKKRLSILEETPWEEGRFKRFFKASGQSCC